MLTVKALRCVHLRNVAVGSSERQDPYVTLTLEENQKLHTKTDVCYSGGTNPQWLTGNWMRLPIPHPNMTCLIQVWDKHSQDADELIATGIIPLGRYDEDGTEEEPMSVDLHWQNGEPAGKFHCILSYDPPMGNVSSHQVQPVPAALEEAQMKNTSEHWAPWLRLQVRRKSGEAKEFLVSRTLNRYQRGSEFVRARAPKYRDVARQRYTEFRSRQTMEQAGFIALVILLLILPWPRQLVMWGYHSLVDLGASVFTSVSSWVSGTFAIVSGYLASGFHAFTAASWYLISWGFQISAFIGLFFLGPTVAWLCMPRLLGLGITKAATTLLGGHLVSCGTVTFVPWITDLKRLKFRVIVVDFLLGNPRDKGFTPRMISFNRFEIVGSITFSDIKNVLTYNKQPCPLKDVRDFQRLSTLRIDHLEIDGLTINLEVNEKNRLNLLDLISEYDRGQVDRALAKKEINPATFRFPNCLEVQVLGARNLRSTDTNGLSDPYYTVRVRKQKINSPTVVKTLNPAFPPRVEQFFVDDPSAVVSIELRDEDVGRPSDFIGQWNTTAKWLLIDPNKLKTVEWERLSEDDRRQGWIGLWAPLVDENFREEGRCGDVHLRMRWVYNPYLPDIRPGERRESQSPLQQLNTLRTEIRKRLGDVQRIIDILKHIPVLLDFHGLFLINDTKLSVHDLLYGRRRDADNIVKKLVAKQREETEKRQLKQVETLPRSLGIREVPAALDRSRLKPESENIEQKANDGIQEVIITSADPNVKLPRNLDVEVSTTTGSGAAPRTSSVEPTTSSVSSVPNPQTISNSERQRRLDAMDLEQQKQERMLEVSEERKVPLSLEQQRERPLTEPPLSDANQMMKETLARDVAKGDRLNAVYPDKLITSAPLGEQGFQRGELADIRKDLGTTQEVYLGAEEDDEAAEERNEDRFDDDEREFDQDGREFLKIRPIIWRKQFITRHGDPGITAYKFLERIVYGIIPKIAADGRLQKAIAGSSLKAFFKGDLSLFSSGADSGVTVASSDPSSAAGNKGVARGVAGKIVGAVKGAAHAVKDQGKLVEEKIFHRRDAASVDTTSNQAVYYSTTRSPGEAYEREPEHGVEEKTPEPVSKTRPVHGQDSDFNKSDLLIAGSLDAVWQGRHRITSLFRRWKSWHMEIKGDTAYYHRLPSFTSTVQASDSVWYTLDLSWLVDAYITDSSRSHNNELVLKFVQDESTLHFRLPNRTSTPTLEDWLAAIRTVAKAQQDRRRLGTTGSVSESDQVQSSGAWPGEDLQPQQRQRGSSLAMSYSGPALKPNEKVVVDVNKPHELGNFEQVLRQTEPSTLSPRMESDNQGKAAPALLQNQTEALPVESLQSETRQPAIQSQTTMKPQAALPVDTKNSKELAEEVVEGDVNSINKEKQELQQKNVTTALEDPMLHRSVAQS